MENNFKVNQNLSRRSTSFQTILEGVTNKDIKNLFGILPKGTEFDEKYSEDIRLEYEGEHIQEAKSFWDDDAIGIYTLYTQYGIWRIGGFSDNQHTQELYNLIMERKSIKG